MDSLKIAQLVDYFASSLLRRYPVYKVVIYMKFYFNFCFTPFQMKT